jgi:hypothetical protein
MTTDNLILVVKSIVNEQLSIMGPLAIEQANKVPGLNVSSDLNLVKINGTPDQIITDLVSQYEKLFGKASIEACRESIKQILPKLSTRDIPKFLL